MRKVPARNLFQIIPWRNLVAESWRRRIHVGEREIRHRRGTHWVFGMQHSTTLTGLECQLSYSVSSASQSAGEIFADGDHRIRLQKQCGPRTASEPNYFVPLFHYVKNSAQLTHRRNVASADSAKSSTNQGDCRDFRERIVDTTGIVGSSFLVGLNSSPMRRFPRLPAIALAWLVMATVVLQPLVALDCACVCHRRTAPHDEAGCDHDDSGRHSHELCHALKSQGGVIAQRTHCAGRHAQSTASTQGDCTQLTFPCDCPSDCSCQSIHETPMTTLARAPMRVDRDLAVAIHDVPVSGGCDIRLLPWNGNRRDVARATDESSALATCALYCRFTI